MTRTDLFITISSLALTVLLIIQVNWILKTAKIKETLFNEKAAMVLSKTTAAVNADEATCRKIEANIDHSQQAGTVVDLGKEEAKKIDSLFQHYMNAYDIHIDYSFSVSNAAAMNANQLDHVGQYVYNPQIQRFLRESRFQLQLAFPDKKQFIIAEMGPMFLSSVILILVIFFLFWRTVLSLMKEKQLSENTTEFLNNMTHEFKTPLTNIGLATKMIQKHQSSHSYPKIERYTSIILEENKKLSSQVEQVLGMTALERGQIPLHKEALDFHQIIQNAIQAFQLQLENKQGTIQFATKATNAQIMADAKHMSHALQNLLDNAIKYSKERPEISIKTFNKQQSLVLELSDKGIGIDKAHQQQIFDKFFRVPTGNVHDVKGFGLGLAYLKKIIELHQGKIELQSEKGNGTTFKITLPNG